MRQIVLDTETTGLEVKEGHRIIEIGCIEIVNRRITGERFHQYLQPDRQIEISAQQVHGISNEFLQDKPRFADIVEDFMAFIRGAELIIHNAEFDVGFINQELNLLKQHWSTLDQYCQITDTLALARKQHPGQRNSLDALCKRYVVDNSSRDLHGALLDAQLLAEVYLAMTGGQESLLTRPTAEKTSVQLTEIKRINPQRGRLVTILPTTEEQLAHERRLETLDKMSGGKCIWRQWEEKPH